MNSVHFDVGQKSASKARKNNRTGSSLPKKPSREVIGELAMRIMFLYEFQKRRQAVAVQPHHIRFAETLAVFAQVRTSPNLFDNFFGGCVVLFEAA
jgi:hypothetical protein